MPFIVRILEEDLVLWERYEHEVHRGPTHLSEQVAGRVHYRLRDDAAREFRFPQVKVSSPAPLGELVGQELFCRINVERGYLDVRLSTERRINIQLKRLTREVPPEVRRLRLRIASIDESHRPPRVMFVEL